MDSQKKKRLRKWIIAISLALFLIPVLLFSVVITVLYLKQDNLVQYAVSHANKDINGKVSLSGSHIAPFANFPMVSIDLENLAIHESKAKNADCLVQVKDAYIGFNLWEILSGEVKIHKIKLKQGHLDIKQHKDGSINIANAMASTMPSKEVSEDLHLDLNAVELVDMDINKLNESTQLKFDIFVNNARSSFKSNTHGIDFTLDSDMLLSVIQNNDTTFFKRKHVHFDTDFKFNEKNQHLEFQQTTVEFENTLLDFKGDIVLSKDVEVDFNVKGHKPNFNLFLAFAPQDVATAMAQFENKGKVYFNASVKGKTANGNLPAIEAHFGCAEGLLKNTSTQKKLQDIGFIGYFSNGAKRDLSTMVFTLKNFKLTPELGAVQADVSVKNFEEPEIDMQLHADFDLDFLAKFSKAKEISGMSGKVELDLRFHDIVDVNHPERALKNLNQAYYSKLKVSNLQASIEGLAAPIRNFNLEAQADGHAVDIKNLSVQMGNSDLAFKGNLSDLPALIHHTDIPVQADFSINAKHLDFAQLTGSKEQDESLHDLRMKGQFLTSAKAVTESKYLLRGEFKITDAYGKLNHYPHAFHDLHLDVLIDNQDVKLKEFKGFLDHSDFSLNGIFHHYDFWFQPEFDGKGEIQFAMHSGHLVFKELFTYAGYNHLPKEYRNEELMGFDVKGHAVTHFHKGAFTKGNLLLDQLKGKLKSHPIALHHFSGEMAYDNDLLSLRHVKGSVGNSDFDVSGNYHLANKKYRGNVTLKGNMLDLDALIPAASEAPLEGAAHDKQPSLYDYAFPNLDVKIDVQTFKYAPYVLHDLHFDAHLYEDHHMDINHLKVKTAEGSISGSGTFSGRDKQHIYFAPKLTVHHLNLDKFLLKFDNFGQDHLVAENLHGFAEGTLTGKIHLHADFVPNLDDSDLEIKLQVTHGKLLKYAPLVDLGSYFEDKDVQEVKFDTLNNVFRLKEGKLTIPEMVICSTLGFLKISGDQSISGKMPMHYQIGVPWSMIKDVARNKLFKNNKDNSSSDEVIVEEKNAKYVYFKVEGDIENYKVSLVKKKHRKG